MRVLWGDVGVSMGIDDEKDLYVDMGEYFPHLGPCDRTKASTVLPP